MQLEIRQFSSCDAAGVIELLEAVFPTEKPWNNPTAALVRKTNVDNLVWVALDGAQVIGTVVAGYDGIRGWIYSLAVDAHHRNRGIGSRLVQTAEQALMELGCVKVNLQIREGNHQVAEFYSRCGFETEDRVSMGKALLPADAHEPDSIVLDNGFTLGPVQERDEQALVKHLNVSSDFQRQTARIPFPYLEFDAQQWLGRVRLESLDRSGSMTWAIREIESNELVGCVLLMRMVTGQRAEIGYWLSKPLWGAGIVTRAVEAVCKVGFERFSLKRIQANVFAFNQASANVLTKAGFQLEGTLRNECFPEGNPVDLLVFGKIAS